jgi:V/A-type H+-transporting ATPase subunit D
MVIHPTRMNLILHKEKLRSITNSIAILRARRKALIREFISTTMPFLRTRDEIKGLYGQAIDELALSVGHEGKSFIGSIAHIMERDLKAEVVEKNLWGLRYKDIIFSEGPVREPDQRGYDFIPTTTHLEEGIYLFERVVESMLLIASYESKMKRLGEEIISLTRKIKVLEERVLPDLKNGIKTISDYISERERESHFRLKRFKAL